MKKRIKEWQDTGLYNDLLESFIKDVRAEESKQISKWGYQKRTPFEWMTYLTEEVGELAQAINENVYRGGKAKNIHMEAVHVATLVKKIINMHAQEDKPDA